MFKSTLELDDFNHRCPTCGSTFTTLKGLRDHHDIVHSARYSPRGDNRRYDRNQSPLTSLLDNESRELEDQLGVAKEMELRHQLLFKQLKSQDQLKAINNEIVAAKQRQVEMTRVINAARVQVNDLQWAADKVTADQQRVIDTLRDELRFRDAQVDKTRKELSNLTEDRRKLQREVIDLEKDKSTDTERLGDLQRQISQLNDIIGDKDKDVSDLTNFLHAAKEKETGARKKLEDFINSLLDRASKAEKEVQLLKKTGYNGMDKPMGEAGMRGDMKEEVLSPRGQHESPLHAAPLLDNYVTSGGAGPRAMEPQGNFSPWPPWSPGLTPRTGTDGFQPPATPVYQAANAPEAPSHYKNYNREGPPLSKSSFRSDGEPPESGYGSIKYRPRSQLSEVSEHSRDTDDVSPYYSRQPDDDIFPVDENGIIWEDPELVRHSGSLDRNPDRKAQRRRYKASLRRRLRHIQKHGQPPWTNSDIPDSEDLTSVTDDSGSVFTVTSQESGSSHLGYPSTKLNQPRSKPVSRRSRDYSSLSISDFDSDDTLTESESSLKYGGPTARPSSTASEDTRLRRHDHQQRHRDALFCVFLYLDIRNLGKASLVCRDWRDLSRHPALWRTVTLTKARVQSQFLLTLSSWCTQIQSLSLEGLRGRPIKPTETVEQYQRDTRGTLEEGIEQILKASHKTLVSLKVIDCGNIITDRCLWLAGCHCRLLQRVAYLSDTDPAGPEVIWALGAGCRDVTSLIVPPLFPNQKPERFTNRCAHMIGWCWSQLDVLCVGGKLINTKGLTSIARHCGRLRVLELDHMRMMSRDVAMAMCKEGLKELDTLALTFTAVTPGCIQCFAEMCPKLRTVNVHTGIGDYFKATDDTRSQQKYEEIIHEIKGLQQKCSSIQLNIKSDYT